MCEMEMVITQQVNEHEIQASSELFSVLNVVAQPACL